MKRVRRKFYDINWQQIQKDNDCGLNKSNISIKYNLDYATIKKAEKLNIIKLVKHKKTTEKNNKERIEKIKKWLKNNPNKHSWKTSKKKSIPCEKFKNILKSNKISFVEEFTPLIDRMFSIDIAFPDKKIGIEINGNQHYSSDGQLKPYYKDRHDLIEKEGWKLYEIHYSIIYNEHLINEIINNIKCEHDLNLINYQKYINENKKLKEQKRKNKLRNNCICGELKYFKSKLCFNCDKKRKKELSKKPNIKILKKDLKELKNNFSAVGRKYGVSDNCIRKWLK